MSGDRDTAKAISDEALNALLDGELDHAAREALESAIAADPHLQKRLERLRSIDAMLKSSAAIAPEAPASEGLMKVIAHLSQAQTGAAQENASAENVVGFKPRSLPARPGAWGQWRAPLAAGLAFFFGGAVMFGLQNWKDADRPVGLVAGLETGRVPMDSALHVVLERELSGTTINGKGKIIFRPLLSFEAKDGRYCREFESEDAAAAVVGVACREPQGWRLEVLLAAKPAGPDGAFQPATSLNAKALEQVTNALMKGEAFDTNREGEMIKRSWGAVEKLR